MLQLFKKVVIGLLIIFIAIQFFQPQKNIALISDSNILEQEQVPEDIAQKLKVSCFDCHSNNTKYPWYNRVAPVSWIMDNHIKDGKAELNFSKWGELSKRKKISILGSMAEEVQLHDMPLKSYLWMHEEAKFTNEEIEQLVTWTEELSDKILDE